LELGQGNSLKRYKVFIKEYFRVYIYQDALCQFNFSSSSTLSTKQIINFDLSFPNFHSFNNNPLFSFKKPTKHPTVKMHFKALAFALAAMATVVSAGE
jgi:hypothetical protein